MGCLRSAAVLALVALSGFLAMLDNTVVNVALPSIKRELALSDAGFEWVAISYVLTFSTLMLLGGRLADLVGRRAVLVTGLLLFTAASALAGLSGSGATLIAARALQGAGAACVMPASLAVVAGDLPAHRRTLAIGVWTAALALALACGPVVGGVLTQRWGWEWVFLLNLPCGALALALTPAVPARHAPLPPPLPRASRRLARSLDLPGLALSGAALALLSYGLVHGGEHGFTTSRVPLGCCAGAAVAAAGFLLAERRSPAPLIAPGTFRIRSLRGGVLAQMLWGVGVNGVFFFTALYLQSVLGFSPTEAGLVFLPLAGALLAATPAAGPLAALWGAHRVIAAGLALVAAGLWGVAATGEGASYAQLQPGLLLIGVGSAFTAPLTVASVADVPAGSVGAASGLVSTARELSGVFGVVLVGVVLARGREAALRDGASPRAAFLDGYASGLRLAAALVLCGAAVALVTLRRTGRHRRPVTAYARARALLRRDTARAGGRRGAVWPGTRRRGPGRSRGFVPVEQPDCAAVTSDEDLTRR